MDSKVNDSQLVVLQWISDGCPEGKWTDGDHRYKLTSVALQNRNLVALQGRGPNWNATITDAGRHYLEHGEYPSDHRFSKIDLTPVKRTHEADPGEITRHGHPRSKQPAADRTESHFDIVAPKEWRRRRQQSDPRERWPKEDPWDERLLVSVKEAAWALSVDEGMIRTAAKDGDLHRVYIGAGTTNYRIVYQSLLAWVNEMPEESVSRYR